MFPLDVILSGARVGAHGGEEGGFRGGFVLARKGVRRVGYAGHFLHGEEGAAAEVFLGGRVGRHGGWMMVVWSSEWPGGGGGEMDD